MKASILTVASALAVCLLWMPSLGNASDNDIPQKTQEKEVAAPQPPPEPTKETTPSDQSADNGQTSSQPDMPVYQPPLRGAPIGRVAGGTRGLQDKHPFLCVLAPDHIGLTHKPQPELYWFISEETDAPIELTVIEIQGIRPLLEARLPPPQEAGVQRIDLSDHGINLQHGVQYKWFVSLVPDANRRSRDVIAGGGIEYADLPEAIKTAIGQSDQTEAANIYAGSGFWYDALAEISHQIEASPQNKVFRNQRAFLAEQVGLQAVTEFEKQ